MRRSVIHRRSGTRSTAVVLILMILLVFVPIAAVHGIARLVEAAPKHAVAARPA